LNFEKWAFFLSSTQKKKQKLNMERDLLRFGGRLRLKRKGKRQTETNLETKLSRGKLPKKGYSC
jgi:hypothetical protein